MKSPFRDVIFGQQLAHTLLCHLPGAHGRPANDPPPTTAASGPVTVTSALDGTTITGACQAPSMYGARI